ncbi:host specificity J domain protein [Escherichia coli DEC3F]|nr:host specificity J domain protein [Escherichia coli DEC3F]
MRFSLRLTSGSGQDSRLVTTAITADTEHRFSGLPPGEYTLTVRAINSYGQQGEPATTTFRINAPAVPATIELTPGYFQITAVPRLAVYDPTVQFEFWFFGDKKSQIHLRWKPLPVIWGPAVSGVYPARTLSPGRISGFTCAASTWWGNLLLWKPVAGPAMMQKGIWGCFGKNRKTASGSGVVGTDR